MEIEGDEGTWVWISFAPAYRMILSFEVGPRQQEIADCLIKKTSQCLCSTPFFVSDGLSMYPIAILKQYGHFIDPPRTGLPGRPKKPVLVPNPELKYAQIIKSRKGKNVHKIVRKVIFGEEIDPKEISTSYIERQNLSFRQDNNRVSRKTIGFSKKLTPLSDQMTLYSTNFNFCRKHRGLTKRDEQGKKISQSPVMAYGLFDHILNMHELLTYPINKTSTN